jgi:hypothetical protein
MYNYQINIIPKWNIIGYDNYFFDDKNNLRNKKTGKILQMQLKGYTKGFYLNGKFKSLTQIKKIVTKYKQEKMPF